MLLCTQHGYGAQNVIKYTTFLQKNSKNSCEQFKKVYLSGQKVSRRVLLRVVLLTFDESRSVLVIIFNHRPLSNL